MVTSEHTPGPWVVLFYPAVDETQSDAVWDVEANVDGVRTCVATICESAADAHLIAAAPLLLEACDEYLRELDNPSPDVTMRRHWRQKMREAIAAARGEGER